MKRILFIVSALFTLVPFVVSANSSNSPRFCTITQLDGSQYTYKLAKGDVCPNWTYIQCVVNGQTVWVIGGIDGQVTNSCPVSISTGAPI